MMTRYRIRYQETVTYDAYVEAESESAARQCYIDGDFDQVVPVEYEATELVKIEEVEA